MAKKIGVWYIWSGVGHYREGKAIADGLKSAGFEVDLVNPLDLFAKSNRPLGHFFVKLMYFLNLGFKWSMVLLPVSNSIQSNPGFFGRLFIETLGMQGFKQVQYWFGRRLAKLLPMEDYDQLICLHPVTCGLAIGARQNKKLKLPILNIFPDEAKGMTGKFYLYPEVTIGVNTDNIHRYFVNRLKVPADQLVIFGHAADPLLHKNRAKIYQRVQNSLQSGQINLGLFVGGFCPPSQKQSILTIIQQMAPLVRAERLHLKVLTGDHYQFDQQVKDLVEDLQIAHRVDVVSTKTWHHIVDVGHQWMLDDINVMFSRPSELVFYSLTTGIPHILFPAIGGQEFDMQKMLTGFAKVPWFKDIEGQFIEYLVDKEELRKVSHDLYHNDYPLDGVENIVNYLKSRP